MKRISIAATLLFATSIPVQSQSLQTVTDSGNSTTNAIRLTASLRMPTTGRGLELFFHEGASCSFVQSYDRINNTFLPVIINGSFTRTSSRTLINNATDDGATALQVNGDLRISGTVGKSGNITLSDERINVPLVTRLAEFDNTCIAPVRGGDLHLSNFWGVAINLNKGLLGDNENASAAVIPNSSSFTINSFTSANALKTLFTVRNDGSVGIGVTNPMGYKLAVAGAVIAEKMKVKLQQTWPDFVFDDDYPLPSLQETATFIRSYKHLPGIPSATEVARDGIDLGEMNRKLLQKIEELTLHLIQLEAKVAKLESAAKP